MKQCVILSIIIVTLCGATFAKAETNDRGSLIRMTRTYIEHQLEPGLILKIMVKTRNSKFDQSIGMELQIESAAQVTGRPVTLQAVAYGKKVSSEVIVMTKPGTTQTARITIDPKIVTTNGINVPLSISVAGTRNGARNLAAGHLRFSGGKIPWNHMDLLTTFVTPNEPMVKRIVAPTRKILASSTEARSKRQLQAIKSLYQTLPAMNVMYTPEGKDYSTWRNLPQKTHVKWIQLPIETLYYGGDCEDLAILFSSMLEAINIRSAMVYTRAHIFPLAHLGGISIHDAINELGIPPAMLVAVVNNEIRLGIEKDVGLEKAWLPIEMTARGPRSFIEALTDGISSSFMARGVDSGVSTYSAEKKTERTSALLGVRLRPVSVLSFSPPAPKDIFADGEEFLRAWMNDELWFSKGQSFYDTTVQNKTMEDMFSIDDISRLMRMLEDPAQANLHN